MFQWPDYLVFFLTLLPSIGIGVYNAARARQARVTSSSSAADEYLMAGRSMAAAPVALSLAVSYISTVTLMGNGAEMYFYGVHAIFITVGAAGAYVAAAATFVPLFHPLHLTSVNQYLYLRYVSRPVLYCGVLLQLLVLLVPIGVFYFGCAIMMQSATNFPAVWTILLSGVFATFYTTLGGFKTVVWVDAFQAVVIVGSMLALVIMGVGETGGAADMWRTYAASGRAELDFRLTPLARCNVWGAALAHGANLLAIYGVMQPSVQRFCAMDTVAAAQRVALLAAPPAVLLVTLSCALGVVAFVHFDGVGCDPYRAGLLSNQNEIIPYFVLETVNVPAVQGLLLACIFAGSFSTISSWLNSATAILWNDVMQAKFGDYSHGKQTAILKATTTLLGVLSVLTSFLAIHLKGTLLQIVTSCLGAAMAPLMVLIVLGATFTFINAKSGGAGAAVALGFSTWLLVGTALQPTAQFTPLPSRTHNCTEWNVTLPALGDVIVENMTQALPNETLTGPPAAPGAGVYAISVFWVQPLGILLGVCVGLLTAALPGFRSKGPIERRLLFPHVRWILDKMEGQTSSSRTAAVLYTKDSGHSPDTEGVVPVAHKDSEGVMYVAPRDRSRDVVDATIKDVEGVDGAVG